MSWQGCDEHCICICTCFEVYLFLGEVAQYEMSKDRQAAEQRGLYRDKVILILSFATVMVLICHLGLLYVCNQHETVRLLS